MTGESLNCSNLELDFRLMLEPGYLASALPEFNVMAVNKPFRLFNGLGIVRAFQWHRVLEMAV
jgi:hypothetical protein